METASLTISKSDFDLLKVHLDKSGSNMSDFNKNKLREELKNAKVYADKDLPADVVSLNSVAKIENVKTGQVYSFRLVLPNEANMRKNKLSVFAPIGIALLGYRTGDTVQWEMPGGVQSFKILGVEPYQEEVEEDD